MDIRETTSVQLAKRMILVHPPEPRKELLISDPSDGIYLGKTRYMSVPVYWNPTKLINPHIGVVGITGSGKSYLVKTFLTRASLVWGSNAIILDWVGEYDKWVRQAGGRVIDLSKEKLNLLELSGVSKEERIQQILSSLDLLLDLRQFPDVRDEIEEALEKLYSKKRSVAPTLKDLGAFLEKAKSKRAARLIKRFTSQGSDFFAGKSTLNIKNLTNSGLVCIDLHSLPTEEIRSLAGLAILQKIKETMRKAEISDKQAIKLFVVLDEAWKIAQDERSDVITIVREGRKYNFALLLATQNPTDMHKTIFSNVGTLFVLRLVLKEFRQYVKESIGYGDFIDQEIGRFGVGDAAANMIFAERQSRVSTFLMQRIDGEEPLFAYTIKTGDSKMEIEIEREQVLKMLYELGLNESQVSLLKSEFEKNDGALEAERMVVLLEKFGYSKSSIISFLRQLGINERALVHVFSLAKMRRASKGLVNVNLEG